MFNWTELRAYMPNGMKHLLKPYFRTLFPGQVIALCFMTFRCNYRCSYCNIVTNFDFGKVAGRATERAAEDWLRAIENLPPTLFYFAGGEPFLYAGLPDLINAFPVKHSIIGIVTNGTAKMDVYRRIKKRIGVNVSFHREFIEEEPFIKKLEELKELFNISVNVVATRENMPFLRTLKKSFSEKEIAFHIDRFMNENFTYTPEEVTFLDSFLSHERRQQSDQLDYTDYEPKLCGAGKNYINIMPNGEVYTCAGGMEYIHSHLVKDILDHQPNTPYDLAQFKMGNIFEPGFQLRNKAVVCSLPCRTACDRDFTSFKRMPRVKSAAAN
jgi:MoaA/NifB/PqqE/SkfB family radical SAM enzyme